MKDKERFYLSLTIAVTIFFSLFCLSVNLLDKIYEHLHIYLRFQHSELLFNVVLCYVTLILFILYRYWKKALRKKQELEDIVSSINSDVLMVGDSQGKIIKCSKSVKKMLDYDVEEIVNRKTVRSIIDIHSKQSNENKWHDSAKNNNINFGMATGKKRNGDTVPLEITIGNLRHSDDKVILLRDITKRKNAEESLQEMASKLVAINAHLEHLVKIDPLTELLNRRGIEEYLVIESNMARREGAPLAAILLDCDNFKKINDTMGHAVGDVVLKEVGKRIKESLRSSDHIARVGGDEFLVFLPGTRLAEAVSVSEKLRIAISTSPLPVSSESINVTASLGVASLPSGVSSIEEIMSLTRLPLQRSKTMGKNTVSTSEKASSKGRKSMSASTDITGKLLRGDCMYAVCQPIFHLTEERVAGYEFFGRTTIQNFETPSQFLGFSLENNILTHVDLQCLKISVAASSTLKLKARFHVNLLPSTMLATPVENLLKIFPPERKRSTFCLEISEQQFIGDPTYFKEYIRALKEAGILVAIDDLGFGRSSLESLIILEPDLVKIDRTYVNGIGGDTGKRRPLERMIKILGGLGAEIIAEGIETKEDLNILKEMGVIYGQGYLWGKPARIQPEIKKILKDTDKKVCEHPIKLVR